MKTITYPNNVRVYQNTTKNGTIEMAIFDSEKERSKFVQRYSMGSKQSIFVFCPRYERSDGKTCYPLSRKL